jgi:uncharacterized membrane protein
MKSSLVFDPLLPLWLIAVLTLLILVSAMVCEWRGLKSFTLRAIAAFLMCGALLNPQKLLEERTPRPDVVLILKDNSASMDIAGRAQKSQDIETELNKKLATFDNIEISTATINPDPEGTRLTQTLIDALGRLPSDRIAAVFAITDGQIHDLPDNINDLLPPNVPFHALIVGEETARDRRLDPLITPKFGLVGEQALFDIKIDDPGHEGERAKIDIRLNGELQASFNAVIGNKISIPLKIEKRGVNTVELSVEAADNELTLINNLFVAEISGIRDRLRVLLITGEPHMGGRAWRNLLKSDPSVDLVQFTILTNPGVKSTNAPARELSLIQFPERELFEEKLSEFDLIIFDQFRRRSMSARGRSRQMLKPYYIANIARYVENGGALLVATGPAFAGLESLARSPLIAVLPARPTGEKLNGPFRPELSEKGHRHPITSIFNGITADTWGHWYRTIEAEAIGGDILMVNDDDHPLLIVDKVKEGRTALLLSDQAWLWSRGHDGGGPYNEMFRRLAHWLMGEPDLEAERLSAHVEDGVLHIDYQTLDDQPPQVEIISPTGETSSLELKQVGPGHFQSQLPAPTQGAYRISYAKLSTVAAAGALNPTEFKHIIPTNALLAPLVDKTGGGSFWVNIGDAVPSLRQIKTGANAAGTNFAGLIENEQYSVTESKRTPFGPTWLYFLLIFMALLWAWRLEGK